MAYSDLGAVSPGDPGASTWANQVRANFQAGVPDAFTSKGDIAGGTGPDAASRLEVGDDDSTLVAASGETTGLAWQIQPACRVYNSAAIDPATSTWVTLTFNSERFDTDAMHDTVTNTGRLTVPSDGDGLYMIGGCVQFGDLGGKSTDMGVRIRLNGATIIAREFYEIALNGESVALNISCLYSLSATDYVQLQVYTSRDVNVELAANYSPEFWAIWQRRA